ncbi:predicted protein [Scheffersomyces stipitis CBS 6054]|uniref:Uncharacterized protein n=1 Tax=Scheffersomyces stipitis (strain ATCC 58785 / CBS 6054 / NBRC 10063 / NRRL Y-11545) TaxID=322104 RepID=A3LTK5_PICST|nr:predicted protein [Scheffersomyces stipitis CBS 6054]ABN66083.2 predicted protein [Scheffersomyces stipitis CBS 6054]KAG2732761.1 hypothetical protein G9P44_003751 [Scheffersomyces stipitis]
MEILGKNVAEWGIAIKQKQWFIPDTLSVGLSNHLIDLLNKVLPENLYQPRLEIDDGMLGVMYGNGFHFLYNNQANNNLGSDGYDNYQAPTSQGNQLYSRRLWVKGSINFGANIVRASDQLNCIEKIDSVRRLGLSTFVNINRDVTTSTNASVLKEARTLLYTNEPYEFKPMRHSFPNFTFTQEVKLTSSDLLKYSMLTYNMHKIHIDKEHCETVENLPNVIVHGPFMVTLLLYWFRKLYPEASIESINYKNLEPCFVDESFTLASVQKSEYEHNVSIVNVQLGKKYFDGVIKFRQM